MENPIQLGYLTKVVTFSTTLNSDDSNFIENYTISNFRDSITAGGPIEDGVINGSPVKSVLLINDTREGELNSTGELHKINIWQPSFNFDGKMYITFSTEGSGIETHYKTNLLPSENWKNRYRSWVVKFKNPASSGFYFRELSFDVVGNTSLNEPLLFHTRFYQEFVKLTR